MTKKVKNLIIILIVAAVFAAAGYLSWRVDQNSSASLNLDEFAKCLKNNGASFYGGFWCSHCQSQKKLFGESEKFLPYVECSTPDGNSENQLCKDAGIKGYPTWQFKDKSKQEGEISLKDLAVKTGCQLPN